MPKPTKPLSLNANKLTIKIEENEISLTNSTKMQKKDLANDVRKKNKKKKRKKLFTKELTGLSPYALWLSSFKQKDIDHQLEKEHKKIEKAHLMKNIQKSIEKKQEIISESLAQILENQGHWDDAKKMYEAILYKYPEKSSYFASKISNLYTK